MLSYVEAGAGIGVATDSIVTPGSPLRFVPLTPTVSVPLVLVWQEDHDDPPVQRSRELVLEWKNRGRLWHGARKPGARTRPRAQ